MFSNPRDNFLRADFSLTQRLQCDERVRGIGRTVTTGERQRVVDRRVLIDHLDDLHQPILILAALLTVYIVLGILYESYIHPITILSTLPSAGVGAFLALLVMKTDFSIIALIGIILLIGIVKKNAIMMIDFALQAERIDGKSSEDAIYQACILRFRPIMMTTMAAMLGGLPLAIGTGTGSEIRRPLGIAIVGGLVVSQMLTLYTTPVIYLYLDGLSHWWARIRGRTPARVNLAAGKA